MTQFATQLLNGLQLGVALFLMSAGLTLVLGIMNFVNLAHGSFFMIAAYVAATTYKYTQSFVVSGLAAVSIRGLSPLLSQPGQAYFLRT